MTDFIRNVFDDIISEVEANDRENTAITSVNFPIYLEDNDLEILVNYFTRHGYKCYNVYHTNMTVIKKD